MWDLRRKTIFLTYIGFSVFFVFLVMGWVFFGYGRSGAQTDPLGDDIIIEAYFKNGESLATAYVSIPILLDIALPVLWTVYIDIDQNGKFEHLERGVNQISAGGEAGLAASFPLLYHQKVVEELYAIPAEETRSVRIVLEDPFGISVPFVKDGVAARMDWDIGSILDPDPDRIGGITGRSATDLFSVPIASAQQGGGQGGQVNEMNRGVPDLGARRGKPNECVPLSFANSLLWLARTHNFQNRMPTSTDNLVDELASDMNWTTGGVKNEDVMAGKKAFTDRHQLPIVNKKIENEVVNGRSTLWDKIISELNDGEDVELIIDFKQSPNSSSTGGHAVTVVGANNANRRQVITVHDPATPPNREESYVVDRNGQIVGYHKKAYVNFIVSESATSTQQ